MGLRDGPTRKRARKLLTKFAASPTLPVLGWTKVVESIVSAGPTMNWVVYATIVTLLWIFADDIRDGADALEDKITEE